MGKIIRWTMRSICNMFKDRLNNNFDCVVFIDGNRGLGKSTLAYRIAAIVKGRRLKDPGSSNFDPWKDIVYSRVDVMKALATKKRDVIFADEMVNVAYRRDFYVQDQKTLLKMLNMYRDSENLFLGCIPDFLILDKHIQQLVALRITVVRRGVAILHGPIRSLYKSDPWDIDNNRKIEMKWGSKPKYKQLSTFLGILTFSDMTPGQREQYELVKQDKRNQLLTDIDGADVIKDNMGRFIDRILAGKISEKMFKEFALINDVNYTLFRGRIRDRLAKKGVEKQLRELLLSDDNKKGKGVHPNFNI